MNLTTEELATVARLRRLDEGYSIGDVYADFGSGIAKQEQHDADKEIAADILLRMLPDVTILRHDAKYANVDELRISCTRAADTIERLKARITELEQMFEAVCDDNEACGRRIAELEQQVAARTNERDHWHEWVQTMEASNTSLMQQVAATVKHAEWLNRVIDEVALALHGWTTETRQVYVLSMLSQQVAALRADAERYRELRPFCVSIAYAIRMPYAKIKTGDPASGGETEGATEAVASQEGCVDPDVSRRLKRSSTESPAQ